jgi:uncharacterized membrane protein YidH (DUF202 family)
MKTLLVVVALGALAFFGLKRYQKTCKQSTKHRILISKSVTDYMSVTLFVSNLLFKYFIQIFSYF